MSLASKAPIYWARPIDSSHLATPLQGFSSSSSALASFRSSVLEAFRKPAVNRSKQFASLLRLALVTPEAGEAYGGAEFQDFACWTDATLIASRNDASAWFGSSCF